MKVLLDTSVEITNYLDPYYKVKIITSNDSSVTVLHDLVIICATKH